MRQWWGGGERRELLPVLALAGLLASSPVGCSSGSGSAQSWGSAGSQAVQILQNNGYTQFISPVGFPTESAPSCLAGVAEASNGDGNYAAAIIFTNSKEAYNNWQLLAFSAGVQPFGAGPPNPSDPTQNWMMVTGTSDQVSSWLSLDVWNALSC